MSNSSQADKRYPHELDTGPAVLAKILRIVEQTQTEVKRISESLSRLEHHLDY